MIPNVSHNHICNHEHDIPPITQLSVYQYDPTRTLSLRNEFAKDMRRRFSKLKKLIRTAIVDEDAFGLLPGARKINTMAEPSTPGRNAFAFPKSADKIKAFNEWLKQQENLTILQGQAFRGLSGEMWTDKYIENAYQRGVKRARNEMRARGYDVSTIEATGGINIAMNQPFHAERVGLLYTRTFNDLQGITDAMSGQLSRILAQGMAEGQGPREIARRLTRTISGPGGDLAITDTLGRYIPAERRALQLARTEVIRAHADATLEEYKSWRVEGVSVKSEFVTAQDDRVCFPKNTMININLGRQVPIQCIEVGDKVLTRLGERKVIQTNKRNYSGDMVEIITVGSNIIICTANHPVFCDRTNAFIRADEIKVNDRLENYKNERLNVASIRHYQEKNIEVYDLTVDGQPEFYANGILVHNCSICEGLEGQVFTLEEAQGLIPQHIACRCLLLPVDVTDK